MASAFQEKEPGVKRTRISIAEFGAAISLGSKESMDSDEVECLISNMIYKVCCTGYRLHLPTQATFSHTSLRLLCLTQPPNPSQEQADHKQSLMKGYIAREAGMVVLSKTGAFPGTGV